MENELLHSSNTKSITENKEIQNSLPITTTESELLYSTNTEGSIKCAIKSELLYNTFIDQMDYRGIHVDFHSDGNFLQVIAELNNKTIPLGFCNYDYKAEIRKVIDLELDTIDTFSDLTSCARLLFFDNYTNKDIKLVYRGRILKIYPVFDENSLNLAEIRKDSVSVLKKVLKLEKFQSN